MRSPVGTRWVDFMAMENCENYLHIIFHHRHRRFCEVDDQRQSRRDAPCSLFAHCCCDLERVSRGELCELFVADRGSGESEEVN